MLIKGLDPNLICGLIFNSWPGSGRPDRLQLQQVIRPPLPELMLGFGQVVLLFNLFCRSEQAQLL